MNIFSATDVAALRRARRDAYQSVGQRVPAEDAFLRPAPVSAPVNIASVIEHCTLDPCATRSDVVDGARLASDYGFRGVCVNPRWVRDAADALGGSRTAVVAMISFPLGADPTPAKVASAYRAKADGAKSIDMVVDFAALKARDMKAFMRDITEVVNKVRPVPVKAILEMGLLDGVYERALAACLAELAGASFVKTSTGFLFQPTATHPRRLGAEPSDVGILTASVTNSVGIKAAGSIRTYATALTLLKAGATRIGTSNGPLIVSEAIDSGAVSTA